MKTLIITQDNNLVLNTNDKFQTNLGWDENFIEYENQALDRVVNDIENYETLRYIHEPYLGINSTYSQTDIWFYFYFISGNTYVQNYEATGLSNSENSSMLKQSTYSFFRLEFYKTNNNEKPDRTNRKLVFAKNLSLPSGEKFYYTGDNFNDYIYVPVFVGNNYRNKENMYIFWFQDTTPYDTTSLTGNTFWMTAKYYNAKDGNVLDFTNKCLSPIDIVNESDDFYYQVDINMNNYTYQTFEYDGTKGQRAGTKTNPIKFYEKGGANC
jgi:hypothetical protein